MEGLVRGDVVVLSFPYSDLTGKKKRPALVVANVNKDFILSEITSQYNLDHFSIILLDSDFKDGSLSLPSVIKPYRIFTAEASIIQYKVGSINLSKFKEVQDQLFTIFS